MKGNGGHWRGRAERIAELEAEIVRLKKVGESVEQNRSNKMFESRMNSPEEIEHLVAALLNVFPSSLTAIPNSGNTKGEVSLYR